MVSVIIGVSVGQAESSVGVGQTIDNRELNTPLAAMLPPELKSVDVTTYFPEFRKNQVKFVLQYC